MPWHSVKEVAQCLPADASFRWSKQRRQIAAGASKRCYRSQRLLLKLCAKCSIYQSKVLKINEKCVESLSLPAEAATQKPAHHHQQHQRHRHRQRQRQRIFLCNFPRMLPKQMGRKNKVAWRGSAKRHETFSKSIKLWQPAQRSAPRPSQSV